MIVRGKPTLSLLTLFATLAWHPTALAADLSFDLLSTQPLCAHEGKPDTWCTSEDKNPSAEAAGIEKQLFKLIDSLQGADPAKAQITLAYASFSNRAVFEKLCEKGKRGFRIEGFFDRGYSTADTLPVRLAAECQAPGQKNVTVSFLGQKDLSEPDPAKRVWRIQHNKFLMIDRGDGGSVKLGLSSGNLSQTSTGIHFDHWVWVNAPAASNLVTHHRCLAKALQHAIKSDTLDDPADFQLGLNTCLKTMGALYSNVNTAWIETALEQERMVPLFSPDQNNTIYKTLSQQIRSVRSGGKIHGSLQHFLHYGIAGDLIDAVKRDVDVRLIMDDDVILGLDLADGEVPGVSNFYRETLASTVSGMKVRFLQTNSAVPQLAQNKFLIFEGLDGGKSRVFSGAGHLTTSGLMSNYENFYLSQDTGLTEKYKALFESLWKRTATEELFLKP